MKKLILLLFIVIFNKAYAQYPKGYFRSPLNIPIKLAGTFGELRSNHFHAGIDIKTKRTEGFNVYAAADGYVSRIKVSLWGYGKVIYITHPNGYTTVYAHLKKFGKGIEEYVKNIQYQKESYETGNIFPKKDEIPVKKGQIIGLSGSTGGYVAPHLHFEIRDSKTEHIINPMLFGFLPKDTINPSIFKLIAYPVGTTSRVNGSTERALLPLREIKNGVYRTNTVEAFGAIGFGINTTDQLNGASNRNGIYSLEMHVNGKRVYYQDFETFSFAESKYINLHIDYEYYAKYRSRVRKTFRNKKDKLSIYEDLINNGVLDVQPDMNYSVTIKASDFKGNTAKVIIPVKGVKSNVIFSKAIDSTNYKIEHEKFHKFSQKGVSIAFPKNTFYKDVYLDFKVDENGLASIHQPTIPLDRRYTLTFDATDYSDKEKKSLYIANLNNEKHPRYVRTVKKENKFYTTTKTLGNYQLLHDTVSPKIYRPNFKNGQWINHKSFLKIKIRDDESGINDYKAFIDGEWILMEYNLKRKELYYDFSDKKLVGNKHIFKIVVSDNVGNTNTYSATFYRKP